MVIAAERVILTHKPKVYVLNGSCLDVADDLKEWMDSTGTEAVIDDSLRTINDDNADELVSDASALILPAAVKMTSERMRCYKKLQALSVAASGYEWLDLPAATENGVVVTNAPVAELSEAVAEQTFGLMLALTRQIPLHHEAIRQGRPVRKLGTILWRKTLGIVGLGNIGKAVARRARGFDMRILAATPHPNPETGSQLGVEFVSLEDILSQSDFISLHVRMKPGRESMIGASEFRMMKPTAFLINTARQQLVDEEALTEAVMQHRIAGAAMDDPPKQKNSPLLDLPNFVCAPHMGVRTTETLHAVLKCAFQNAVDVIEGRRPNYLLNPEVYEKGIRTGS